MTRKKPSTPKGTGQKPYALQTTDEREALQKLQPTWGKAKDHKLFRQQVLTLLALIDAEHKIEASHRNMMAHSPNKSRIVRQFQRRAEKVRTFARQMEKPMAEPVARAVGQRIPSWPKPFVWSPFPVAESLGHAEACDEVARFFAGQPSRFGTLENEYIVKLLILVRLHTGKAHLNPLKTLLIRPCGDKGITGQRLDQLLRDHVARYHDVREEFERAKRGLISLLGPKIQDE
jgi:hypothetical protein